MNSFVMTFKNITEKSASPDNEIQVYADISPRNSFSMSTKSTSLRAPTPDGVGSQTHHGAGQTSEQLNENTHTIQGDTFT